MLYKRSRLILNNDQNPAQANPASPALRMAIFYDCSNTLERSRKIVSGLAHTLETNRVIQFTAWQFDALKESALKTSIDASLQASEVAMLAADASVSLPANVEQKLEQWLAGSSSTNRALFVFLEGYSVAARASGLPFDRLQTLAGRYGVDFFAHIAEPEAQISSMRTSAEVPAAV
ncbi:MAG TPA: hypothetical protein VGH19_24195 [Verrucomicrobiae bacterium]